VERHSQDLKAENPELAAEPVRFALRGVGRTDPGLQRVQNEDAFFSDDDLGLYLVCDGMGGHASGAIASDLAIRTIVQAMKTGEPAPPPGEQPLQTAIKAANQAIFQRARVDESCHGMGTTAVGLLAVDDLLHVAHCGDSRVYLLRAGQLTQLTRDHSLENLYRDKPELEGQLGPAMSNVIVRAVGLDENVEVDHRVMAMEHGDVYLLCCDGLTDLVEDWMIREIMTSGETLDAVADNLVRAANANGGSDNITVVLVAVFASPDAHVSQPIEPVDSIPPPGDSIPPPGDSIPPPGDSIPPPGDSIPPPGDSTSGGDARPPRGDTENGY
jgi:serine/threonine protein phosphatase PrpC